MSLNLRAMSSTLQALGEYLRGLEDRELNKTVSTKN